VSLPKPFPGPAFSQKCAIAGLRSTLAASRKASGAPPNLVPRSNRGRFEGDSGLARATPAARKLQAIIGLGRHAARVITR